MPAAEYQSLGFVFDRDIAWVNDANASFNGAQSLVGSPQNAIPSAAFGSFEILFSTPTDAFGFVVINNVNATIEPSFTAYNAANLVIETVTWSPAFTQGTLGIAEYGFMGIASPQDKIARITLTKQTALFDDFLFATIPGPGAAGIVGLGLTLAAGRRRC